jgi:hypothetical protein
MFVHYYFPSTVRALDGAAIYQVAGSHIHLLSGVYLIQVLTPIPNPFAHHTKSVPAIYICISPNNCSPRTVHAYICLEQAD